MARLTAAPTLAMLASLVSLPASAQMPPAPPPAPPAAPSPPLPDLPPDLGGPPVPVPPPAPTPGPAPPQPATDDVAMFRPAGSVPETAVPPSTRPGLEAAIGMGASLDARSRACSDCIALVPAFVATIGFGTGGVGIQVAGFSNQAVGRSVAAGAPIDRLGLDLMLALRPGAAVARWSGRPEFGPRVARSFTVAVGPGVERATSGRPTDSRLGLRLASHVDVPLSPAHDPSELRLRLGARRFLGPEGELSSGPSDSCLRFRNCPKVTDNLIELFGALAVVF